MKKPSYESLKQTLSELLENEHGGCSDNTCDIAKCMENGFYLWASHLFIGTGVASKEFEKTYALLPKRFEQDAESERVEFLATVESCECPNCGAVVYDPDSCEYHCSNCGQRAVFLVKTNSLGPDGVEDLGDRWVDGFNVLDFKERSDHCIFSVAMKYGKMPGEFTKEILERSVGASLPTGTKLTLAS
nr:hypothetical protein BdHM001_35980 [Bdellovibrio sp. HM001]